MAQTARKYAAWDKSEETKPIASANKSTKQNWRDESRENISSWSNC